MIEGLEAVTRQALGLALDAAALRQQALASNIANANVQGYAPLRVSFEEQLDEARRSMGMDNAIDAAALSQVRPVLWSEEMPREGGARLDLEVAEMARNAVNYQALIKGMSRHLSILAMAAADGKR